MSTVKDLINRLVTFAEWTGETEVEVEIFGDVVDGEQCYIDDDTDPKMKGGKLVFAVCSKKVIEDD